jgi:hypothetical protein
MTKINCPLEKAVSSRNIPTGSNVCPTHLFVVTVTLKSVSFLIANVVIIFCSQPHPRAHF